MARHLLVRLFACVVELFESSFSSGSHAGVDRSAPDSTTAAITPAYHQSMGEAPDDESPRRLTRRRIIVLAVVGSLVVVGVAAGIAVWQLRDDPPTLTEQDPPTLTEQVAAVPGISEELAASMVDEAQSTSAVIDRIVDQCAKGTSARAFGARVATGTPPELRAAITAAWEIIYKYYCPEAASSLTIGPSGSQASGTKRIYHSPARWTWKVAGVDATGALVRRSYADRTQIVRSRTNGSRC